MRLSTSIIDYGTNLEYPKHGEGESGECSRQRGRRRRHAFGVDAHSCNEAGYLTDDGGPVIDECRRGSGKC